MKKVIMITGNLASLKSSIATQLGQDLKIMVFCKDKIKEILGDSIGFQNREENLKLSEATFRLIADGMEQTLKVHDSVILESNFRAYEVEEIKERCHQLGFDLIVIFLTGNTDILYQRYLKRQPERHSVHTSTGTMSYETFKSCMKPFEKSLYGDHAMMIDTSSFDEKAYQELLKHVYTRTHKI